VVADLVLRLGFANGIMLGWVMDIGGFGLVLDMQCIFRDAL